MPDNSFIDRPPPSDANVRSSDRATRVAQRQSPNGTNGYPVVTPSVAGSADRPKNSPRGRENDSTFE